MFTFSSKPVKEFEGRSFHSIIKNDKEVVGYSEIIRDLSPIIYFAGDAIIFKEAILTKGEIFGGIIRGGEIAGSSIFGGEINGGLLKGGEFYNGTFNSGILIGGIIRGGTFSGCEIRDGEIFGGTFNKDVKIFDGKWYGGEYSETPMQIYTPEVLWYFHKGFDEYPDMIYFGCESGSFDTFDVTKFRLKHQFKSEIFNDSKKLDKLEVEYKKIQDIFETRYK